jgi:hypothetical protein
MIEGQMQDTRLSRAIQIDLQTKKYILNLEKRIHHYTIRLTDIQYQLLQEEAKEAEVSVAEIIRSRLWPK